MAKRLTYIGLFFILLSIHSKSIGQTSSELAENVKLGWFLDHLFSVTEVMVSDVATPTGAARFYAYTLLGAYAVQSDLNPDQFDAGLLSKLLEPLKLQSFSGPNNQKFDVGFCAMYSMLEVGKLIMPSGIKLEGSQQKLISQYLKSKSFSRRELANQIAYAKSVASQVVAYAANDGFGKLSTLKRYSPSPKEGRWYPTPPAYMGAVDPEWRTIRTFFIHDHKYFAPEPPIPFSLNEDSDFYKILKEVYDIGQNLSDEQGLIANFWDCNPFFVSYSGHMAIGLKKISPGGHWIGIAGIASQKAGLSLSESISVHTLMALSLHDAFVSCWREKYHSDRIRPVTAINKYIDPSWQPLLQTPPFPEYTSGHSVISRVCARILTAFFGDNFDFVDTSEVFFGLPEREFPSFLYASDEAAISRLYGGIHFRDAIDEGVKQGDKIADHVLGIISPKQLLLGEKTSVIP